MIEYKNKLYVTCLAAFLIISSAVADDQSQKAEVAKEKAGILEQKAASNESKTPPTTSPANYKTTGTSCRSKRR